MGYYSDTTAKLLDQIGNPYTTTVQSSNPAFDLSSLILAMMFMPQGAKGLTGIQESLAKGTAADVVGDIRGAAPSEIPMGAPSMFPTIFDTPAAAAPVAAPAAAGAGINPMAAMAAKGGGLPFSLAQGNNRPSILGNEQQVLAFLKMLGII